jgi:hypothetical protein
LIILHFLSGLHFFAGPEPCGWDSCCAGEQGPGKSPDYTPHQRPVKIGRSDGGIEERRGNTLFIGSCLARRDIGAVTSLAHSEDEEERGLGRRIKKMG